MKDTDKVTLTIGQLKKLVKEDVDKEVFYLSVLEAEPGTKGVWYFGGDISGLGDIKYYSEEEAERAFAKWLKANTAKPRPGYYQMRIDINFGPGEQDWEFDEQILFNIAPNGEVFIEDSYKLFNLDKE